MWLGKLIQRVENSDSNWGDVEARDNEIKSWVGSGDSNAEDVRE